MNRFLLNGGTAHSHKIEGIGVEFTPPFLSGITIDGFEMISDQEGFAYTKQLAKQQGLLVGSSRLISGPIV